MRTLALRLSVLLLLAGLASAQEHINISGRDVAVWKATGPQPRHGYPLIVFSHGFGGCNIQTKFLMEALAKAGYLVLAPNHKDADCAGTAPGGGWFPGKALTTHRPQQPFRDPQAWSDATYKDRRADIEAVLDTALRGKSFRGIAIDPQRVGLAGHSLGGYTSLGLAGAWPSWKDARVKAVLALSPYCEPYVVKGDLGQMNVPVMYQGGTRDFGVTPTVNKTNGAYDRSSNPKYYVELDGAGHFAWINLNKHYRETINTYSVAFFDRYLKDVAPDPLEPLFGHGRPKDVSGLKSSVER